MAVKVLVHRFKLGDVDDPEIYAAQPIYEWQQTEAGKWVMEHSQDTFWKRHHDYVTYGYEYVIIATLSESDATWYKLKFS